MSPAQRLSARRSKASRPDVRSPKSLFKVGIIFLILIFVGVIGLKLFNSWNQRQWIPGSRVTIVVATDAPKIYSYNPQDGKLTIIEVPEDTQVDTSYSYGTRLVRGLWQFGYQEGKKGDLLQASLQKSLGMPIDGWVDEKGEKLFAGKTLDWPQAFLEAISSSSLKTNLTFFDRLSLLLKVGTVNTADRVTYSLEKKGIVEKTKLQDGSDGYIIDPDKARTELANMYDEKIFVEAQRMVVVNTTNTSGLATNVATVATVLGVRVIGTRTSSESIKDCVVRGLEQKLQSFSALRVARIFGCKTEAKSLSGAEDLELVLGSDFAKQY